MENTMTTETKKTAKRFGSLAILSSVEQWNQGGAGVVHKVEMGYRKHTNFGDTGGWSFKASKGTKCGQKFDIRMAINPTESAPRCPTCYPVTSEAR